MPRPIGGGQDDQRMTKGKIMSTTISVTKHAAARFSLTKVLTIGAIFALLVLTIGGALAERLELRAASDRLSLGDLGHGARNVLIDAGPQG